jgi:MGT family glycosyltransferase
MATILFFNHPAHGHTNPTLPLVTELVRRGERVIYYSSEDFQQAIEQTGATFRSYGEAFPFDAARAPENQFTVLLEHLQASKLILERLLPSIRAERPDAILYDQLAVWGPYLAQILNVPTICSVSMFVITPWMVMSDPAQIRNRLVSGSLVRQMRQLSAQMSATYHVRNVSLFDLANNRGQLNIVYTSRAFQPDSSSFDDTYKFVGPSLLPRANAPAFPYEKLDPEKPLIYISLGTLFNAHPEFYRHVLAAFAQSQYQIVLSLGHKTPLAALGDLPAHVIVQPSVPQLDILQRAALFITHGGMNSVSEALYYGVPLLSIPQSADQPWVARRVVQLGAGKMLRRAKVHPQRLRSVADEILAQSSYAQASTRLGKTLRAAGGYMRAADEIQQFLHRTSSYAVQKPDSWREVFFNKLINMMV